jgi:hypothetical protein
MDPFSLEPVVVPRSRRRGLSPPQLIVLSFAAATAVSTVVLSVA